jgi:hypothetical protein
VGVGVTANMGSGRWLPHGTACADSVRLGVGGQWWGGGLSGAQKAWG